MNLPGDTHQGRAIRSMKKQGNIFSLREYSNYNNRPQTKGN